VPGALAFHPPLETHRQPRETEQVCRSKRGFCHRRACPHQASFLM
jgi:hypothetical protein